MGISNFLSVKVVCMPSKMVWTYLFDSMNVTCVNSHIVYSMTYPNDLTLLDFKTITSTYLTGRYTCWRRESLDGKTGSKRKYKSEQGNLPPHLPEFKNIRRRLHYCHKKGTDLKSYLTAENVEFSYDWSRR